MTVVTIHLFSTTTLLQPNFPSMIFFGMRSKKLGIDHDTLTSCMAVGWPLFLATQVNWSAEMDLASNQKNHPKSEVVKRRCWHQRPPAPWGYWNAASEGNSWRCMVGKSPKPSRKSAFSWWSDSVKMDDHCNYCVHIFLNQLYSCSLVVCYWNSMLMTASMPDGWWCFYSQRPLVIFFELTKLWRWLLE